jgi:hypothetical protein
MSDAYVTVSTKGDAVTPEYESAVVFNAVGKDAPDNQEQANEYAGELSAAKPWLNHLVVSLADFQLSTDPENSKTPVEH